MVLRSLKDRLKKFNVAVAETEHQDLWQRAGLGVVADQHRQTMPCDGARGGGRRDRAGRARTRSRGRRIEFRLT